MLGQREICGLFFVLCCVPAFYLTKDRHCLPELKKLAKELQHETENFIDKLDENYTAMISAPLPSCEGHQEVADIVKAFYTLFLGLNKTIEDATAIESLKRTLDQQRVCLSIWNVTNSSFNITYPRTDDQAKKTFLLKASERYKCIMQKMNATSL